MNIFELFGTIAINNEAANKAITDTGGKANQLASTMKTAFNKAGQFAVTCGKVVASGLAVGAAGVGVLMKKSISEFANYEQLVGGIETLFKDSSDKVMQYAEEAYKKQGMSANAYMSTVTSFSASLISGLKGDTAAAAEMSNIAITDMADNANKFGTDISMIQNAYQGFAKQNYTMLDNLKLGYGGTAEEMARLINDSGVLGKAIKLTAKDVNKVSFDVIIAAIHEIQTRMGVTGTTAKEAAETISGSFASFKASWSNLLVGLANEDDIEPLVDMFFDAGQTVLKNVWKVVPKIKDNLVDAFKRAGERVRTVWMNNIWPSIQEFAKTKLGIELPEWSEIELKVSGWWAGVKTGVQDLCSWTLKLFDAPNEAASEAGEAIKTWWTETALPGIKSVSQWTLGLFGVPVEDEATVKEHVNAWWNTAGTWVAGACNWTLRLFGMPDEDATAISNTVLTWWNKTKDNVISVCQWVLNLPETPLVSDTANKINTWWEDVKKNLNLTLDITDSESFVALETIAGVIAAATGHPVVAAGLFSSAGYEMYNAAEEDKDSEQMQKALEISEAVENWIKGKPNTEESEEVYGPDYRGGGGDGVSFATFQDTAGGIANWKKKFLNLFLIDDIPTEDQKTQNQWSTDGIKELEGFGPPSSNNELQTTIQNWTNTFDVNAMAETIAASVSEAVTSAMGGITITTGNVTLNDGALVGRILPQINLGMGQLMMMKARGNA